MKIGIPRSLFYYYFGDLWINFFNYLNINVVLTPETNKEILDLGMKYSVDEACLSLKNYIGHVMYLKDKCNYILIPRVDNYGIDNQTCTNFLALYDIVKNIFNRRILNYNIDYKTGEDELLCTFEEKQRAITPGQAVVFYDGEYVLGGGTIIGDK